MRKLAPRRVLWDVWAMHELDGAHHSRSMMHQFRPGSQMRCWRGPVDLTAQGVARCAAVRIYMCNSMHELISCHNGRSQRPLPTVAKQQLSIPHAQAHSLVLRVRQKTPQARTVAVVLETLRTARTPHRTILSHSPGWTSDAYEEQRAAAAACMPADFVALSALPAAHRSDAQTISRSTACRRIRATADSALLEHGWRQQRLEGMKWDGGPAVVEMGEGGGVAHL